MGLTLTVQADPGSEIEETFKKAIALATLLDMVVEFDFNTVTCMAIPNGSAKKGTNEYHQALRDKKPYKLAVS